MALGDYAISKIVHAYEFAAGKNARCVSIEKINAINSSSTANTPAIISTAIALAANTSRKGWMIQNTGTNPLFVLFGSGATTAVFHAVLKGGTGASDGLGASLSQFDGVIYTGIITIAGTNPLYVVTELT